MKKLGRKHKVMLSIIGILVLIGLIILYNSKEKEVRLVDLYTYNDNDLVALTYGTNTAYTNENSEKWEFGSTEFGELKSGDLKGVQVMYTMSDGFEEDLKEISEQYRDKQIWLSLRIDEDITIKDLKVLHNRIETELLPYENIQSVYSLETALKLYKTQEIEWIYHDVKDEPDIESLYNMPEELRQKVKIVVNDYMLENEDLALSDKLNAISRLYYSIPLDVQQVRLIFNQGNLNEEHHKVVELYNQILSEKWISTQEFTEHNSVYTKLDNNAINQISATDMIASYREDIEYIGYKFNNKSVQKSYRFPFKLEKQLYKPTNRLNKLKVIIKLKDEEKPFVQEYYLDFGDLFEVGGRSERTTQNYPTSMNVEYEKSYIPVLMYHEFKDIVGESDEEQSITVSTRLFEEQIEALLENGYTPIHFKNLKDYFEGEGGLPPKPIIITADDGYLSNYTIAYPILKKYNIPATFFITSAYVGVDTTMPHFTWDEAREMEKSGLVDIQSHTHEHALLDEQKENEVRYQLSMSFARIEEELGKRDVKVLAYPQFLHNKNTIEWASQEGVDLQITNLAKRKSITKPFDIKRIHVGNTLSPEALIEKIKDLTMK